MYAYKVTPKPHKQMGLTRNPDIDLAIELNELFPIMRVAGDLETAKELLRKDLELIEKMLDRLADPWHRIALSVVLGPVEGKQMTVEHCAYGVVDSGTAVGWIFSQMNTEPRRLGTGIPVKPVRHEPQLILDYLIWSMA